MSEKFTDAFKELNYEWKIEVSQHIGRLSLIEVFLGSVCSNIIMEDEKYR